MSTPEAQLIVFLMVSDLERAHRFYAGALGLSLVLDQADCRVYRVGQGGYVGLCERHGAVGTEGMIVTIVTDDVAGTHDRLVAAGVEVHKAPAHNPEYAITHAFYRDPDGHLVEVQRFDDPAWDS